jgi:hypothetical protein
MYSIHISQLITTTHDRPQPQFGGVMGGRVEPPPPTCAMLPMLEHADPSTTACAVLPGLWCAMLPVKLAEAHK